jgi:polygalacturonase
MISTRRDFTSLTAANLVADVFDVRRTGAKGNGRDYDTQAIQRSIDRCSQAGGGVVLLPAGTYLSGTLELKSGVTLHLAAGSRLVGSTSLDDFPERVPALRSYTDNYTRRSLIYAEKQERIAIEGAGVIDGRGAAFKGPYLARPYMLRFIECRDVAMRGVTLRDSPMWVQHFLACDGVHIHGITVHSHVNSNNDGIDIDACHRVRISDCDIDSGDDAIVLKSTTDRACEDVVISNCVLRSACNALKLGTESNGGFRNIAISNCSIRDTRLSGLAVECVDGGALERVVVSGLVMNKVGCPIFVRLGDRARPFKEGMARPPAGVLRDVSISGVYASGAGTTGCSITGLPDRAVEGVTLRDVRLSFVGGGTSADAARQVPEERAKYPEHSMFGTLPAHGFFCRHVRDLRMDDVRVSTEAPDGRPAFVTDDVEFRAQG